MARWKLSRLTYGNEEFSLVEGEEVTLGRGIQNNIVLSSIVVSRNHCVINVQKDKILLTDLKSSNGIYIGLKKIAPNVPYSIEDSEVIGIGWTKGAPVADINDPEKYMFKLTKEPPILNTITFQNDHEGDSDVAVVVDAPPTLSNAPKSTNANQQSNPSLSTNTSSSGRATVKRKLENSINNVLMKKERSENYTIHDEIINILSDSENEEPSVETNSKKIKLEPIPKEAAQSEIVPEIEVKTEKEDLEYDPFKIKQEYMEEPIILDSESEDESVQWRIRLSQNSPGKPLVKSPRAAKLNHNEETSYSQIEDFEEDEYIDDLISIPEPPPDSRQESPDSGISDKGNEIKMDVNDEEEEYLNDLINLHEPIAAIESNSKTISQNLEPCSTISNDQAIQKTDGDENQVNSLLKSDTDNITMNNNLINNDVMDTVQHNDVVDGSSNNFRDLKKISSPTTHPTEKNKYQQKETFVQPTSSKTTLLTEAKHSSTRQKKDKKPKYSSPKKQITNSQKEERKKKLKEIAKKEKERKSDQHSSSSSKDKGVVNAKRTTRNRGAFLTDEGVVKPTKQKDTSPKTSKSKHSDQNLSNISASNKSKDDIENKKKSEKRNSIKEKEKSHKEHESSKNLKKEAPKSTHHSKSHKSSVDVRPPLKSLRPPSEESPKFTEKPDSITEKPDSKVERTRKSVRFSDEPPKVYLFQIEDGNNMKKTSLVKMNLVDARQAPVFSLEKIMLMKILRWNPSWLEEQTMFNEPPPILGNKPPAVTVFHSFSSHSEYVSVVGDLLLMEIWECLSQGYMRIRQQPPTVQMRIASLPPVSKQDKHFELFNLSVNVSVPNTEVKTVPRMGEIILVSFGPENARARRFFYVHNVRTLPSPPSNIHSFFCISLHTCYTEKMKNLKLGELMLSVSLSYIHKELMLFDAMEQLEKSPLSEAILKPEPVHFIKYDPRDDHQESQWTRTLNESQQIAVRASVSAALGDRPGIQMVQGPPGTGKSGVICAMVMSYFYNEETKKQAHRGKILICATSNAAVDELVIRLLKVRHQLPKSERFKMVRVGRAEAMHPRALEISSQQLAQRDVAARQAAEPHHAGLPQEIRHLEAKINMWKTQEQSAKDPVRSEYCKTQIKALQMRLGLLRSSSGGGAADVSSGHLLTVEKRIIEGADVIVTTLASAQNHKMRGLRGRIALCVVDEAGQAIEPETLAPLTLDVTRLALIGDPQQLPGFICSQRAKKLGLGESLFYRLTSCAEQWGGASPVVLLDRQYRMQPAIADYPNRAFYAGRVRSHPPPRPDLPIPPYSILSIASGDKGQGASGANEMEAWGVARLVTALHALLAPLSLSLAVITPYNAHKDLIKRNLRLLLDPSEGHIEVNTVDSFQGQERDVVVASLARSQGVGFLTDTGRMNVMLTRARHALIVCLNPHAMLRNYQWRTLIEDAQQRKLYRVLPHKLCQGPAAGQIPHADVLKYVSNKPPPN